jgi:TRAP-type C4-dicarboxylate transport system permease small subunit
MVIMVFGNVVLRYGFNSGITISDEMSRYCFIWLTYIGAMIAMREKGGHLGVDTLVKHLPVGGKKACLFVSEMLMLFVQRPVPAGHLEDARTAGQQCVAGGGHLHDLDLRHRLRGGRGDGPVQHQRVVPAVTGQLSEDELVQVVESEDLPHVEPNCRGAPMTVAVFISACWRAMAIGMPIAYALLVCGVALMAFMAATGALPAFDSQILAQRFVDGADNFPLLAVPFFLLAGEFMNAGGLSRRIVNLAMAWVGHFRGGLGYVAVLPP